MAIGCVIVVYHNRLPQVAAALASVKKSGVRHLAVVDNSPEDGLKKMAGKYGCLYLAPGENIGFAAAANLGASALKNELLLFLNPDAALLPRSLPHAAAYLSGHASAGVAGLLLRDERGLPELSGFGPPVTPFSLFVRRWQLAALPLHPEKVGWVSGGAMLIRQSLFAQLGGFDPQYFLYWEDVDLCRRVRQAGYSCVLLPGSPVLHARGASLDSRPARTRYYDQSADKYFRKHYSKPLWLLQRYSRRLYRIYSPLSH